MPKTGAGTCFAFCLLIWSWKMREADCLGDFCPLFKGILGEHDQGSLKVNQGANFMQRIIPFSENERLD